MPNWSTHLPRAGTLLLSVLAAAAAYAVYVDRSSESTGSTARPVATDVAQLGPDLSGRSDRSADARPRDKRAEKDRPAAGALEKPAGVRSPSGHAGEGPGFASEPAFTPISTSPAVENRTVETPVAPVAPVTQPLTQPGVDQPLIVHRPGVAPKPKPRKRGSGPAKPKAPLENELRSIIDEGSPLPSPAPRSDGPTVPQDPAAPTAPTAPTAPAEPPPAATPAAPPAAPVDDAGLDDTAAGQLDETDLGTPLDDGHAAPPAAPDAPVDDAPAPTQPQPQAAPPGAPAAG
jgi:hypothetical protein